MTKVYLRECLPTQPREILQLFVCIDAVGNLDVQQSMVWIDGASVSLTGWPRVYGKKAQKNLRSDLAHKHGLGGQIAVE